MKSYTIFIVFALLNLSTYTTIQKINNTRDFSTSTQYSGITVIEFYNPHCGACQRVEIPYRQLSKKYPNARFYQINSKKQPTLFAQHNITATPTFYVYKNGKRLNTVRGANINRVEQIIINNR